MPEESDGWDDRDWDGLLHAIRYKQCTPFLGAGACFPVLPLGRDLSEAWAREYDYPFSDRDNLVRVAQFVAVKSGPDTPKYKILREFEKRGSPNFDDPDEIHRVVADLQLPVYITTNYDSFMVEALKRGPPARDPMQEVCEWFLAGKSRKRKKPLPEPTPERPLVFHLHGTLKDLKSMVLTEDDYLDFLMYVSEEPDLLPPRIQQALSDTSLLFLGYSLQDMNFKVLFRKIAAFMRLNQSARHVSVQLAPGGAGGASEDEQRALAAKQRDYLRRHFDLQKVKIYWGTCRTFATELRKRWDAFNKPG